MVDPRVKILAERLVNYSCSVKPGDKVLIESYGPETALINELIKAVYASGAVPFVWLKDRSIERTLLMQADPDQLKTIAESESMQMRQMHAYIGIRSGSNKAEMSDVPAEQMAAYRSLVFSEVHQKYRIPHTRWVIISYPTPSMAQQANCSTEAFEDFYFDVCTLDYAKMSRAMDPLVELMNNTDQVRIVSPGTELSFSIQGIPAVKCAGHYNIPDGEVYTAPIIDSVEGTISYNTSTIYDGKSFENIRFEFEKGRIVKASANDTIALNRILDTDKGARFIGEFALGVNPFILHPMKDILFDEKICGSLHFTPGNTYDECSNGNVSGIHWDLVLIQRPDHGGGSIYFDGRLVRRDGEFVIPELMGLNPDNLK